MPKQHSSPTRGGASSREGGRYNLRRPPSTQPSTSDEAGPHGGMAEPRASTSNSSESGSSCSAELTQLRELMDQLEQVDREVETFHGGECAYRGLDERLMQLLCAVDGVEVGGQQNLRDLQSRANASIAKCMNKLERKGWLNVEEPSTSMQQGETLSARTGTADDSGQPRTPKDISDLFEATWVTERENQYNQSFDSETAPADGLVPLVTRSSKGELVLEEEALRRVVCRPEVGHRMLAIVSVVGPPSSGSAFLVRCMQKYLAAKGKPGWLEEAEDMECELPSSQTEEGDNPQLDDTKPETEMMLWTEPFIISDNLAGILVSSILNEDMLTLALSTLVSSLQVINIAAESFTWPDNDILQFLGDFSAVLPTRGEEKALQRCVALMEDASHEPPSGDSVVHGVSAGGLLRDKCLAETDGSPTKKKLLSMALASYQQFECFARPPNVKRERGNDGIPRESTSRWLFGSLKKRLVEWLLQPSCIRPKLLGHRELRAHELPTFMACLLRELQRPDRSPSSLMTALATMEHERLQRTAVAVYKRLVVDRLETAEDPAELHRSVVELVLHHVDQDKIFGDCDLGTRYRSHIEQDLGVQYDTVIAPRVAERERVRQQQVKQATDVAVAFYQNEMSSRRPWDVSRSLQDVSEIVVQQAVTKFLEKVGHKVSPEEQEQKINKLKRKAEAQCEVLMPEYKAWRSEEGRRQTQARLEQGYQRALQVYRTGLEPATDHSGQMDLDQLHQQAANQALAELQSLFPERDSELDLSRLGSKLGEEIKLLRKEFERTMDLKRKNKDSVPQNPQHQAVELFEKEAKALLQGFKDKSTLPITREKLIALLDEAERKAMNSIASTQQQGCADDGESLTIVDSATKTIQALRAKCESAWQERVFAELQKTSDSCITSYVAEMLNFIEQEQDASKEAMSAKQDDIHMFAWNFFPKEIQMYSDDIFMIFIADTIQALEEKYRDFVGQLEKRQETDVVDRALHQFDKTLKDLCSATMSRATLEGHYTRAKTTVLNKIREALEDSPQLEKDLQRAQKHMEETLAGVSKHFDQANMEQVAYNDALAAYKAEMTDLIENPHIPNDYTVLMLHTTAHKAAIDSYMTAANPAGKTKEELSMYLKKLEEDISIEFENIKSLLAVQRRDARIEQDEDNTSNYAIGIDLGTTFSCVKVYKDGKVQSILNKDKKHTTPSVVYFGQHSVLVGEEAKFKGFEDPVNCISEVKRIIGRPFDDPVVQSVIPQWAFQVGPTTEQPNTPKIRVFHTDKKQSLTPEEVSALLLKELKHQAEVQLGSEVHDTVVTIPAYFTEPQRDATLRACKEAGLNVLRLLNEPTAAAMAYGLQTLTEEDQRKSKKATCHRVLVFDFGGGTCDVSILELRGSHFVVKASHGDNKLGGEDYDDRLTKHLVQKIEARTGLKLDPKSRRRLRYMAEIAKCRLTDSRDYQIHLPNFPEMGQDLDETVHRDVLEDITADLSRRSLVPVRECLQESGFTKNDIEMVILAGGSSRIPKVQQLLGEFFPGKPLYNKINPDEAIASGAALQAALLTGECQRAIRITDITPFSLGIGVIHKKYSIIIKKNSAIPCSNTMPYETTKDYQSSVSIPVYQGEHTEDEFKNTKLGEFVLENIALAPAGVTKLDVTFKIDANGILTVTAEEVRYGERALNRNKKSVTITKRVHV